MKTKNTTPCQKNKWAIIHDCTRRLLTKIKLTVTFFRHGCTPVVSECDGEYTFEKRGSLLWQLPMIDGNNKSGTMEFACQGCPDDFFPVRVTFHSQKMFSGIQVSDETLHFFSHNSHPRVYFSR